MKQRTTGIQDLIVFLVLKNQLLPGALPKFEQQQDQLQAAKGNTLGKDGQRAEQALGTAPLLHYIFNFHVPIQGQKIRNFS